MATGALAHPARGPSLTVLVRAEGWVDWLGSTGSEHRLAVLLIAVGLIASGSVVRAAVRSHRSRSRQHRQDNLPTTPRYASAPVPVRYAAALGIGAFRAVAAGEPVNLPAYQRPRRAVRAELVHLLLGDRETPDRVSSARADLPRTLNSLLGGRAELIGEQLFLVEEVLRRRALVGVDLWRHDLDEFAARQGLVLADRVALHRTADEVERAEAQLRGIGVLGANDRVPTLLAWHWAAGVHLVRAAWRIGWLAETDALARLDRVGQLAARWYPSWPTVLGALLLPDLLNEHDRESRWQATVVGQLRADPRSPLAVPFEQFSSAEPERG